MPSKLFVCPKQYVNNPPSEPLPFNWIKDNLSKEYEILNFDGYTIDFAQKKITSFFMKKEFEYETLEDVNNENILSLFNTHELKNGWLERLKISHLLDVPLFFICWPNDYPFLPHSELSNPIFIFQVSLEEGNSVIKKIKQCTLQELVDFISSYRRRTFSNVKPLRISKSHMECYLSTTSSPWPGDLDGLIFEKSKQRVICILEFKTHNLDSAIEDERISQYADEDIRRFNVLGYLQKNLFEKQKIPVSFLFIIWGKKLLHKKIKIQKMSNSGAINDTYVDSPIFTKQFQLFTEKVLEICNNE